MGFSRDLWSRLSTGAAEGRQAWSRGLGGGAVERAMWLAFTVLLAIPIFVLLALAVIGALALTIAAVLVSWLWSVMMRAGAVRTRGVTVIDVSPTRSGP
ncbi:MAG: hypothetical protein FJ253_11905 [Phycisphaerae bacterium]|nr:hypothetical protein [Phycisphaerae bacterium]